MGFDKPNYTQVANLILDDLLRYMNGAELKVVLVISRQTLGYHRERHPMTITMIEEFTGLSRPAVVEAIDTGERRGLIQREQLADGRWAFSLVINDEVLATEKENLPESVKKVNRDSGKESLPSAVKKVNRRGKESLPSAVKKSDQNTPALKKGKERSKEMVGGGDPTNQPSASAQVANPGHHALASALLIKVGLGAGTAKRLADARDFEEIRRQVAGWLPDRDADKADTGALIWRIESGEWNAPELSSEFKRSQLYRQFRTDAECEADDAIERQAQERITELDQEHERLMAELKASELPRPDAISEDIWRNLLPEIEQQLVNTTGEGELKGSSLTFKSMIGAIAIYEVCVASSDNMIWLRNRAAPLIRKTLNSALLQRVEVEIVAAEPAQAAAGEDRP